MNTDLYLLPPHFKALPPSLFSQWVYREKEQGHLLKLYQKEKKDQMKGMKQLRTCKMRVKKSPFKMFL